MPIRSGPVAYQRARISGEQLRDHVLLRSSSLYERLENLGPSGLRRADQFALRRLDVWRKRFSLEGREFLARRLSFDRISLDRVIDAFCEEPAVVAAECDWYPKFEAAIDGLANGSQCLVNEAATGLPFSEILQGLAVNAVRELSDDPNWVRLCDTAQKETIYLLLQRISAVLQWCLYADFDQSRRDSIGSSGVYTRFVDIAGSREWITSFFTRYAGAAKPLALRLAQWQCFMRELLSRFDNDKDALVLPQSPGQKRAIHGFDGFPSDSHDHGRFVTVIRVANDQRLVYKPTGAKPSEAWFKLLGIVGLEDFSSPKVLDKGVYSWHEFVGSYSA